MSHKHGTELNGMRSIEDVRLRCVVDEETGCWRWSGAVSKGAPRMWCVHSQCTVNGGELLFRLKTGRKPPGGMYFYRRCEERLCVNPAHRALGTRSTAMKARKFGGMERQALAKMTISRRKQSPLTEDQVNEIIASGSSCRELGKQYGVHPGSIWRIKKGHRWAPALRAASVFAWRP